MKNVLVTGATGMMGKNTSIKSTDLAASMFAVGLHGSDQGILENKDILGALPGPI